MSMQLRLFGKKCVSAVWIIVVLAFTVTLAGRANAQVAGATLTGTVLDASGAVIPNAQVSISDVATGVTRTATTNNAGLYNAPNVLPGNYEVKVTAPGFRTQLEKGITLTVGAEQLLNFTLQVGQTSQTVEVTTEAPTVELTSSELGATVNSTTVRELPLNGRSWTDLANLQPGVVAATSHAAVDVNRGFGSQLSISGARPQQNNYRLDGISINDYSNGGPGSVLGQNLGVEAIQEFSVLTSNYSAEYGKTSGGVVNAISRSGTNQFHGSVYEFLRNSALDAANFFDNSNGLPKPPFRRNQFGASASGPIRKDRTFIFGDYEGIRQSLGTTVSSGVPSANARLGILADPNNPGQNLPPHAGPCPANSTLLDPNANVCVDNNVAKYLPFFHLPTGAVNGDIGQYAFNSQEIVSENYFTTRVDEKISDRDSLFGTYAYDYSPLTQPDLLNNLLEQSIAKRQIAAFEENHVFSPALGNSFRLGYNRDRAYALNPVKVLNPVAADTTQGWAPGFDPPQVTLSGLNTVPGFAPPTFSYAWNAYQLYDDAFVTKGLHTIKFGFSMEKDELNETTATADYLGTFKFGSIAALMQNEPKSVVGSVPGLVTPRYMRTAIFGGYLQDDWRIRPRLTLNLGLRYEMSTVPSETKGKITNLPTLSAAHPDCGILFGDCAGIAPYFSNPTLHNFEPRVGFAWDPFGSGKTAVRGGFGMFDVLPLLYTTVTMNGRGAPFFEIGSSTNAAQLAGTFPGGALPVITSNIASTALEYGFVEHNPKRNYVMQWNLNVQREFAGFTATVGYVGSRGRHQAFRADDGNIVIPTLTSAGYLYPNPVGTGTLVNSNPNVGAVRFLNWPGNSAYNAMQIGVLKKMSHGLQVQGSYTWGKSIDNNSGVIAGDTFGNGIGSLPWFDLRLTRALSDYNVGRTLVINTTWELPTMKSGSSVLNWAANGWELEAIFKANDDPPFSATFGTDGDPLGIGSTDTWAFPSYSGAPGCSSLINARNPNNYIKTQCFAVPTAPSVAFFNAPAPLGCDSAFGQSTDPTQPQYLWCFNLRGTAGRNDIPGPGLMNLDFSTFKNNYIRRISENFNIQFRAEIFNILNHANFALPISPDNTDIFDSSGAPLSTGGLLTKTTTEAREIQFALKVIW
jgi:Carboxypeptidase regulatory-like domain/TonB-dependent Receptor Plug Domain/TonB dependent receptor